MNSHYRENDGCERKQKFMSQQYATNNEDLNDSTFTYYFRTAQINHEDV